MAPIQHWLKPMHYRPERDQPSYWSGRTWIGDSHRLRADGKPLDRPGYREGDLMVIYLTKVQRCPAVARALGTASFEPGVVERGDRPGDGELYGWVTPIEVLAHKPVSEAPHFRDLGIEGMSLARARRLHISAEQFEIARRALRD